MFGVTTDPCDSWWRVFVCHTRPHADGSQAPVLGLVFKCFRGEVRINGRPIGCVSWTADTGEWRFEEWDSCSEGRKAYLEDEVLRQATHSWEAKHKAGWGMFFVDGSCVNSMDALNERMSANVLHQFLPPEPFNMY